MFRVVSYQAVLRILFVSVILLVACAFAQQSEQKPASDAAITAQPCSRAN